MDAFVLTRHQYYYRPNKGVAFRSGRNVSSHTLYHGQDGQISKHPNEQVVEQIKAIQADDDLRCGYMRMKAQLELKGYQINAKKVYRMMREHDLLLSRIRHQGGPYVKHRCARPVKPLTLLEMDIKLFWVEQHRRYAFVLTILDTFTRAVLHWTHGYSMRWKAVQAAWEVVIEQHLQPADMLAKGFNIEVRSDNGPQFLAQNLRSFFAQNHLCQVFTHPYTPQENGHVESFHAIINLALRYDFFWTLEQLEIRLAIFYEKYNNDRVHSSIAYLPPMQFWKAWELELIKSKEGKKKKLIFQLKIPRYSLSGYLSPEQASRSANKRLNAAEKQHSTQVVIGADTQIQPSV